MRRPARPGPSGRLLRTPISASRRPMSATSSAATNRSLIRFRSANSAIALQSTCVTHVPAEILMTGKVRPGPRRPSAGYCPRAQPSSPGVPAPRRSARSLGPCVGTARSPGAAPATVSVAPTSARSCLSTPWPKPSRQSVHSQEEAQIVPVEVHFTHEIIITIRFIDVKPNR